jgi:hypothetical protein
MNNAFEDSSVSGWEGLEHSIILPDENDSQVVACALVAGADAIVTNNVRDFPDEALAPLKVEMIRFDDFLLDLSTSLPRSSPRSSANRSITRRTRRCLPLIF